MVVAFLFACVAVVAACGGDSTPAPTAAPVTQATKAATPTPAATAKATPTPTPAATPKATVRPTPQATAAATPKPTPPPVEPEGTLTVGFASLLEGVYDPHREGGGHKMFWSVMYDWLVGVDAAHVNIAPTGVASSWTPNAAQDEWTFIIKEGITFSNGEVLDANDVKASIDRVIRLNESPGSTSLGETVEAVSVVGPYEVLIKTANPTFTLPYELSYMIGTEGTIIPDQYLAQVGDQGFMDKPIGSGPYTIQSQGLGDFMQFEAVHNSANPHHRVGVPKYEIVRLEIIPDLFTRVGRMNRGDLDAAEVNRRSAPSMIEAGMKLAEKDGSVLVPLWPMNQYIEGNPLGDKRVREAFFRTIPAQLILDELFDGQGRVDGGYPVGSWGIGYKDTFQPPAYDPDVARALFKDAGYSPGDFEMDLWYWTGRGVDEMPDVVQFIAETWENELGIKTNLIPSDILTILQKGREGTMDMPAMAFHITFQGLFRHRTASAVLGEGRGFTSRDPGIEALRQDFNKAANIEEYAELASQLQQSVLDNLYMANIWNLGQLFAYNPETVPSWDTGRIEFDVNLEDLYWRK